MHILIWNRYYGGSFGGSETSVNALLRGIYQSGLKATLVTHGKRIKKPLNPFFPSLPPGIEVYSDDFPDLMLCRKPKAFASGLLRYSRAAVSLLRFFRNHQPDIVHLHLVTFDVLLLLLYRSIFKYRLVLGFRGSDLWNTRQSTFTRLLVRLALRRADAVTSISRHMAACLKEEFGRSGVVCILNGTDSKELRSTAQNTAVPIPPGHFVYCGRLHPDKQVSRLIEIFKSCLDAGCDRKLYIIGDGPEGKSILQMISGYGLAESISVLGAVSHQVALSAIAQARGLLLASAVEGLGNVVLEAMTLGVPVVASAVGGIPELVIHGETGYLFPPGDLHVAREYILRLSQDPELARAMGRRGAEVVCERFTLAATVSRHIDLYQSLLRKPPSGISQ